MSIRNSQIFKFYFIWEGTYKVRIWEGNDGVVGAISRRNSYSLTSSRLNQSLTCRLVIHL